MERPGAIPMPDAGPQSVRAFVELVETGEQVELQADTHAQVGLRELDARIGRGRIRPVVSDPSAGIAGRDPSTLFSSSQLNALAVSVFFGLNLATRDAPLTAVMVDDPLQSLNDVNLLGLVDTLRRTKSLRQLLLSTHDRRLTSLLQRKLRPVGDDRATRLYAFSDWNEQGPTVVRDDVEAEPAVFKIAAA
jgi:DNA repair protein SbcC/Rad50